ncbi:MAG: type II secretion system protein [Phycisphaerales bacterium]
MQRPKGFTLIELLVVISIIALLVGILLPALGAARKTAISLKCLSNHRQLAIGLGSYANDFSDRFPLKKIKLYSSTGIPLQEWYVSQTWLGTAGKVSGTAASRFGADVRPLNGYIGGPYEDPKADVPMALCPADEQQEQDAIIYSWGTSYRANNTHGRSLTINHLKTGPNAPFKDQDGRLVTQVTKPSKTVAIFESQAIEVSDDQDGTTAEQIDDRFFWHTNPRDYRFNTSFCDGHAALVTYEPDKWVTDEYTWNVDDFPTRPGNNDNLEP